MAARREYQSRLRAERAEDTRERIITAARELFAARGLDATTVSAIAARAGVPKPDVSSVPALKRALKAAPSIVLSSGPSSLYMPALFEKLGVAETV